MKILNEKKLIIYLSNQYLDMKKIINIDDLEEYFKEILKILKETYNIEVFGLYNVDVYIDLEYGMILEFEKEELDFEYSHNQIDMKIKINYSKFLYKTYDLDVEKNDKIYIYKNSYYIEKIKNIEFYEIIYKTDEIIKKGKTIVI